MYLQVHCFERGIFLLTAELVVSALNFATFVFSTTLGENQPLYTLVENRNRPKTMFVLFELNTTTRLKDNLRN